MTKPNGGFIKTNNKTRLNYMSGVEECFPNCRCLFCKREGKGYYSPEKIKEREEQNVNKNISKR
jgi:hypothetical protein